MASRELNILIKAKNLAGQALSSVKKDLGGLSKIGATAGQGLSNASRNIQRGAVVAGAAIAYNIKAGIDSLAELQRVEAQTAAVLKSTGNAAAGSAGDIRKRSEALEDLTTIDDKAIQNAQNLLLTFVQIKDKAFEPALKAAIDLNASLGGDEDSLQGVLIKVGRAVNDPVKGITALTRAGVSFTEKQKARIKGLVEEGNLYAAQQIILGELNKEFGGSAAAAADTYAGKMRRVGDAVEQAQMSLATAFLPVLEKAGTKLSEFLQRPEVIKGIEDFGVSLAGAADKAIDFLGEVDWDPILGGLQTAKSVAKTILDTFLSLPPWVQTAIVTGWGLNKLTGGAVGSIVGQLGAGLIKGVLGINAGVVNVRGAVVNAPGGGVAGAGGKGGKGGRGLPGLPIGGALLGAGIVAVGGGGPMGDTNQIQYFKQLIGKTQTIQEAVNESGITLGNIHAAANDPAFRAGLTTDQLAAIDALAVQVGAVSAAAVKEGAELTRLRADSSRYASSATQQWSASQRTAYAQLTASGQIRDQTATTAARTADVAAATRVVAAKDFSPTVVANLNATINTNVSVDNIIRSITTSRVSSGWSESTMGGGI